MDLKDIDLTPGADAGATMQLLHPVTGDPLGITFQVLGQDGSVYRGNLRRLRDILAKEGESENEDDPDKRDLIRLARLAACAVKGWTGVEYEGEPLAYTFDAATTLFTARPWVAEQIAYFRDRRANFFHASLPASGEQS